MSTQIHAKRNAQHQTQGYIHGSSESYEPSLHKSSIRFLDIVLKQVDCLINNGFNQQIDSANTNEPEFNLCAEALDYHFLSPGQKVRAKICLDACIKFNIHHEDMVILAAVAELLHNASLIHDDIQDNDEIRRGQATVWKKFNPSIAICAGDLLLSNAYGVLAKFSQPHLLPQLILTINQQTKSAIEGQSKDIAYKHKQSITLDEYVEIATQKSGALLSLPLELALIAAEKNTSLALAQKASNLFAVGYQIADDLEDIIKDSGSRHVSKSVNITFVMKDLGYQNVIEEAIKLCEQYLDQAIAAAQQLPNDSGFILLSLAEKLKYKIKCL